MLNNLSERPVFHGTMGNRLVAPVVFVCFAILVATVAEGGQRLRFQKTFEGDCEADVQPRLQVEATAGPNLGGGPPKVVVALGTTVQLTGVAHKVTVDERCRAKAKKVAPTWTLSFRAPDGSPVDLTASLRGGNGLSPTFVPTESGAYVARLEAGGKRVDIEIEVLGDPVASSSTAEGRATPSEVRWVRHWNSIGPNGDPGDQGDGYRNSGQMKALAFDPRPGMANVLYAGAANGGVWKSLDRGDSWFPISDHKLKGEGISALAVANDATGSVYVGVGGGNAGGADYGVWKSIDGGGTWKPVGDKVAANCPAGSVAFTGSAYRIIVKPGSSGVVYVAARREGVYRSMMGGECWKNIFYPALAGNSNITDLALDPQDPSTLYVADAGRDDRAGDSGIWKTIHAEDPGLPIFNSYFVGGPYVEARIAIAPSQPSTLYAAFTVWDRADVFRSTDAGRNWQLRNNDMCGRQCYANSAIAVDPNNPNSVFYGEVRTFHSSDGGGKWNATTGLWDYAGVAHADIQDLVVAPEGDAVYAASDGGVSRMKFPPEKDKWEWCTRGLSVAEIGGLASMPGAGFPYVAAGVWHNGSQLWRGSRGWDHFQGGDGFGVSLDAGGDWTFFHMNRGSEVNRVSLLAEPSFRPGLHHFASNPYRPGELFGVSPEADYQLYVLRKGSPFYYPFACADPSPGSGAAWSLDFAPDGSFYLSKTNGWIYHFTLPANPALGRCPTSTPVVGGPIFKVSAAADDSGPGPSVAADPFDTKMFYVADPNATGAERVTHYMGYLVAKPIAANLPDDLGLAHPFMTFEQAPGVMLAADPQLAGVLYLGTTKGLYEGRPDSVGDYTWTLVKDVPNAGVTAVISRRTSGVGVARSGEPSPASGYTGKMYVATYGRGAWESVLIPERVAGSPTPVDSCPYTQACLTQNASDSFCLACRFAPDDTDTSMVIKTSYAGEVGPRACIRGIPTFEGVDQPYFLTQVARIRQGESTAILRYRYAAKNAPFALKTDAIRFEILDKHCRSVLATATVPVEKWWARPGTHLLTVKARYDDVGPVAIPVAMTIRLAPNLVMQGAAPLTVPVDDGATVTVEAPSTYSSDRDYYFDQWQSGSSATTQTLTVTGNTTLVAGYGCDGCGEEFGATSTTLPTTFCGNGICEAGETCGNCVSDCDICAPICGNDVCESGETCSNCTSDCGSCGPVCGNGICESGEACVSPQCGVWGSANGCCCADCGCSFGCPSACVGPGPSPAPASKSCEIL